MRIKTTPPVLALCLLSFVLAGCNGAFIGNIFVLSVTVAIFLGTLSLGKSGESTRSQSDASSSQHNT